MEPEELINRIFQQLETYPDRELRIVNDNNGAGIFFGNDLLQKSFKLKKKDIQGEVKDYTTDLYSPQTMVMGFANKPEEKEMAKAGLLTLLKSGAYEIEQADDLGFERLGAIKKNTPSPVPSNKKQVAGKDATYKIDPTFRLNNTENIARTFETLGGIGWNGLVGAGSTLGGQTMGFFDMFAQTPGTAITKLAKDVTAGTIDFARDLVTGVAASMNPMMAKADKDVSPWLQPLKNWSENYSQMKADVESAGWDSKNLPLLNYNPAEQYMSDKIYNSSYMKDLEDFKKKNKVAWEQPQGEGWGDIDWIESQTANAVESAIEFSAPMLMTGAFGRMATGSLFRKAGPKIGRVMERKLINQNKVMIDDTFKNIPTSLNAPTSIRDMVKAPIARAAAGLQDAAKMQYAGEVAGMNIGNILSTKFESDLEGYHAYSDYLDRKRQEKAEELLSLGMEEEQVKATLEKLDFSKEKEEARQIGEQVKRANMVILGLSNDMTYRMLGIAPKKLATKGFGKLTAEQLENQSPITYALTRPWYSKAGTMVLDRAKEGLEELAQGSVTAYESDKGFHTGGIMDSILGTLKTSLQRIQKPEGQGEFYGGVLGAQVMSSGVYGIQKALEAYSDNKQKSIYKNTFNKNINEMINTFIEPLTDAKGNYREDALNAHLLRTALTIHNEAAQDAANYAGDWQLEHVLQNEALSRLFFETRENGISTQDTTRYILEAMNAKPKDSFFSPIDKSGFVELGDKKQYMAKVESALGRMDQAYNQLKKYELFFRAKRMELTPIKRQRLFETFVNKIELQEVAKVLAAQIPEELVKSNKPENELTNIEKKMLTLVQNADRTEYAGKVDAEMQKQAKRELALNLNYQEAYDKLIVDMMNTKVLKTESKVSKAQKALDTAQENEVSVEEVIDQIAQNSEEAEEIKASVEQLEKAEAKDLIDTATTLFNQNFDALILNESNAFEQTLNSSTIDNLLAEYLQSVKPHLKKLGMNDTNIRKSLKNKLFTAMHVMRKDIGGFSMEATPEKLQTRYSNNGFRNALFGIEKNVLETLIQDLSEKQQIAQALTAEDLIDFYENASPETKNIINSFYNYGGVEQDVIFDETGQSVGPALNAEEIAEITPITIPNFEEALTSNDLNSISEPCII